MRVRGLLTPALALKVSALTPALALKVAALLVEDGFRAHRAGDQVGLTRETAQFGWRLGPSCRLLLPGSFVDECLEKEIFTA